MAHFSRFAIVGSGAIGLYYGGRLAEGGAHVSFLLRSDYDTVSQKGIAIESIAGDVHLENVHCARTTQEIGEVDCVIVAWKTTSNTHYKEVIAPLLGKKTVILTLQNGLGNVEALHSLFPHHSLFGGLCFVCINRIGAGQVHHTASGRIVIGQYPRPTKQLNLLVESLEKRGLWVSQSEHLEKSQYEKLVWNIPFNGLTIAYGGIDTQALLNIEGMPRRVMAIMKEVQQLAAGYGYDIPEGFLENQLHRTYKMEAYFPSSTLDFCQGVPIEMGAIWEEPLKRAAKKGIEMPATAALITLMKKAIKEKHIAL